MGVIVEGSQCNFVCGTRMNRKTHTGASIQVDCELLMSAGGEKETTRGVSKRTMWG